MDHWDFSQGLETQLVVATKEGGMLLASSGQRPGKLKTSCEAQDSLSPAAATYNQTAVQLTMFTAPRLMNPALGLCADTAIKRPQCPPVSCQGLPPADGRVLRLLP